MKILLLSLSVMMLAVVACDKKVPEPQVTPEATAVDQQSPGQPHNAVEERQEEREEMHKEMREEADREDFIIDQNERVRDQDGKGMK